MKEKKRTRKITTADREIIQLISLGYTDTQISAELHYTRSKLRYSILRIFEKVDAVNRPHLVFIAAKKGLLNF